MKYSLWKLMAKWEIEQYFRNYKQIETLKESIRMIEEEYKYHGVIVEVVRMKIRVRKLEMIREVVDRAIRRLEEKKQKFIRLKYDKMLIDTAIHARLGVPVLTLHRWNCEFVEDIKNEMLGQFNFEKMLNRCDEIKVIINSYSNHIAFLEELEEKLNGARLKGLRVGSYIKELKDKKERMERFWAVITEVLEGLDEREKEIVILRFFGGNLIDEEIAARCFVSRSLVTTNCKSFRDKVLSAVKCEEKVVAGRRGKTGGRLTTN